MKSKIEKTLSPLFVNLTIIVIVRRLGKCYLDLVVRSPYNFDFFLTT